ncbi:hypothetical protein FOPE_01411 [Fonsecaea pedrosoi]|nr:hypothetical protein FOPE_01411 [Fonsecaea pedrosoi]
MSDHGCPSSDSSSDWISYNSSSSHSLSHKTSTRTALLSTLRKNPWLTSWSLLRWRKLAPNDVAFGPRLAPTSTEAEPNGIAPGGVSPVASPQSPNKMSPSSHSSSASWARSLFAPQFRRYRQRELPWSLASDTPRNPQYGDDSEIPEAYVLPSDTLTSTPRLPSNPHVWSELIRMDPNHPTLSPNLTDLLTGLSSSEDASRKMAAFKLQSLINDPSFAEHFVLAGGLPQLRTLVLESSGNTLAYSLASFARLLEVDQGWEAVNDRVVQKARLPPSRPSQ